MLAMCEGGRQRTEEEWNQLATAAGFTIKKIHPPAGPWALSLLEMLPV